MKSVEIIQKVKAPLHSQKKQILVHTCCAPCAAGSLKRLCDSFLVTLYFYNPNIDSLDEYNKRAQQLQKLSAIFDIKQIIIEPYKSEEFLSSIKGLEGEKEGGLRCNECFSLRLDKTAHMCKDMNFDFFCTTLTLSPHKNAQLINSIGQRCANKYGVNYIDTDFKKNSGVLISKQLCEELDIYRQNYCGCNFARKIN